MTYLYPFYYRKVTFIGLWVRLPLSKPKGPQDLLLVVNNKPSCRVIYASEHLLSMLLVELKTLRSQSWEVSRI